MNVLVIGYGSIGSRHVRLLNDLGCNVAVVSKRAIDYKNTFLKIADGLEAHKPEYIVISNNTTEHHTTIKNLIQLGYTGTVLVEKPLFHQVQNINIKSFHQIYVAYNLRFHPVIQKLRSFLASEKIISVMAYAGQYLPSWHPERDYRESYSASKIMGGGVLRDLSHELDYLIWLLNGWTRVTAMGGHFSALEITSDDTCAISMVTQSCPIVTLQLNYLDHTGRRFILINTEEHTIEADLIKSSVTIDQKVETLYTDKDMSYKAMHLAVLDNQCENLCSFDEGLEVLKVIEVIEKTIEQGKWFQK